MIFAIIDAMSDVGRLTTVAYGETVGDIAMWFANEFMDNFEMYCKDDENSDEEMVRKQCQELKELALSDALDVQDIVGLSFAVADVSVELYGVYQTFSEFSTAFRDFVSDKPKYVKILPQEIPQDEIAECDRINTLLVRASI